MLAGRDGSAEYPALPRGGAQTSQKTLGLLKEYVEELSSDSCSNRLLRRAGQPAVSAPHGCQTQQACAKQ